MSSWSSPMAPAPDGPGGPGSPGCENGSRGSRWPLLWLYGLVFCSQFKPSEPFLVDFLIHDKGFSNESISQDMFPIWTYARFPLLLLTGIFSEFEVVAGQGVLFVGALCGFATVLLTLFGNSFLPQQIAQITVAANFASRFAVNAVIFQLASARDVQQDVHTMKAVLLLSNAGSAVLGEVLRDNFQAPLSMLYWISAAATGLAVLCSIFLLGSKPSRRRSSQMKQKCMASCSDLLKIFKLPTVAWWTVWALAVNPAHGVALTYWQNLFKVRVTHETDHNGYMLGASYLAAAVVVAACRRSAILRGYTSFLVVFFMLSMGLLLLALTISSSQLVFYALLVSIQCVYEVSASVSTFQVGRAVCNSVESGEAKAPREPRLALLFCVTGVLAGAVASLVQHVHPISKRFLLVAAALMLLAAFLSLIALGRWLYLCMSGREADGRQGRQGRQAADPFLRSTDLMPISGRS